ASSASRAGAAGDRSHCLCPGDRSRASARRRLSTACRETRRPEATRRRDSVDVLRARGHNISSRTTTPRLEAPRCSPLYPFLCPVLPLVVWRCPSPDVNEFEIPALRHELTILRRRTKRPAMTAVDRLFLAPAESSPAATGDRSSSGRTRCCDGIEAKTVGFGFVRFRTISSRCQRSSEAPPQT